MQYLIALAVASALGFGVAFGFWLHDEATIDYVKLYDPSGHTEYPTGRPDSIRSLSSPDQRDVVAGERNRDPWIEG